MRKPVAFTAAAAAIALTLTLGGCGFGDSATGGVSTGAAESKQASSSPSKIDSSTPTATVTGFLNALRDRDLKTAAEYVTPSQRPDEKQYASSRILASASKPMTDLHVKESVNTDDGITVPFTYKAAGETVEDSLVVEQSPENGYRIVSPSGTISSFMVADLGGCYPGRILTPGIYDCEVDAGWGKVKVTDKVPGGRSFQYADRTYGSFKPASEATLRKTAAKALAGAYALYRDDHKDSAPELKASDFTIESLSDFKQLKHNPAYASFRMKGHFPFSDPSTMTFGGANDVPGYFIVNLDESDSLQMASDPDSLTRDESNGIVGKTNSWPTFQDDGSYMF